MYLKRRTVAGFDRCVEINRNSENEGISRSKSGNSDA